MAIDRISVRPPAQAGRRASRPRSSGSGGARAAGSGRSGWSHLVGVLALVFSLFPIMFVVSASFNPLGTLSSSELIPTGVQPGELPGPVRGILPALVR